MHSELYKLTGINVKFYQAEVVRGINLTFRNGEVCSIIGENAAGKSTLMKVLAGVITNYTGQIFFKGMPIAINSPNDAHAYGIHMLFHEPLLFDRFTVEYNIFCGNELHYRNSILLKKTQQQKKAREILDFLECDFGSDTLVANLSHAQRRIVEIAKALMSDVKLLIFDEVTSQYTEQETENLLRIIKKIKDQLSIVYISHKLEEVLQISDKIVVMRDGEIIESFKNKTGINANYLIEKMAGKDFINRYPKIKAKKGETVLKIDHISSASQTVSDVSLYSRRGEIVGVAGFHDSGKTDLIKLMSAQTRSKTDRFSSAAKLLKSRAHIRRSTTALCTSVRKTAKIFIC